MPGLPTSIEPPNYLKFKRNPLCSNVYCAHGLLILRFLHATVCLCIYVSNKTLRGRLLLPGAPLFGITLGEKNVDEFESILGKSKSRGPIEEGADLHIMTYWLGEQHRSQAELELYFYADGHDKPAHYVSINWKKYWW